jgi:hypothetical protein
MTHRKQLPRVVYQMCVHGAYIVGSYARALAGTLKRTPRDFDLMVPLDKWQVIALMIPATAKPNKFGGWRFSTDWDKATVEVDVWPDTLDSYLGRCKSQPGESVIAVDFINNRVFACQPLRSE